MTLYPPGSYPARKVTDLTEIVRRLTVPAKATCPMCKGARWIFGTHPNDARRCPRCN